MSLFERIKSAIFHNPLAAVRAVRHPSAGAPRPALGRPASDEDAGPARPAGTRLTSPTVPADSATGRVHASGLPPQRRLQLRASQPGVDVEERCRKLAPQRGRASEELNWRTSIVDLYEAAGPLDSSLQHRKELATELGYTGDQNDSAAMNTWLHKAVMRKLAWRTSGKVPSSLQ